MRQIRGKFFMVQQDVLTDEHNDDHFGNPRVNWPARSVMLTREAAMLAAKRLATMNPGRGYFVLEAVEMFEVPVGKAVSTKLRCKKV
jgi:hypothetical protein